MNEFKVVPIDRTFQREQFISHIETYMTPSDNDIERLESRREGDNYKITVFYLRNKKKSEWVDSRSVELTFDQDAVRVQINYRNASLTSKQTSKMSRNLTVGTTAGVMAGLALLPVALPITIGVTATGVGAALAADAVTGKKFIKDILEIVSEHTGVKLTDTQKGQDTPALQGDESISIDDVIMCSCGAQLSKDMKFCPECGKQQNQGSYICSCGNQVEQNMKYCPFCGAKVNK